MTIPVPWLNHLLTQDPWSIKAVLMLALALISLWLSGRALYWHLFLGVALTLAMVAGRVTTLGVLVALITGAFAYGYYSYPKTFWRYIFLTGFLAASAGLYLHIWPGFYNWRVVHQLRLAPDSVPLTFYFNFDKPLIGLFIIGFAGLATPLGFRVLRNGLWGVVLGSGGAALLLGAVWLLGHVRWDPKWPEVTGLWMLRNLVFTCLVEEAYFRGFMQRELSDHWPRFKYGAIAISAVAFGLSHISGGWLYVVISTAAGFLYASVYQRTRSLEAAIFCHFTVNVLHFSFFSYPRLA